MIESVEAIVIGAGVIGLAVARTLAQAGGEVVVLEAESTFGAHTSSRNSEVVHAGLYYPIGSLKARACIAGRRRLIEYCEQRSIALRPCGKLIVATDEAERAKLQDILENAHACGATELAWCDRSEAARLEPQVRCIAALWSPNTAIVDSHGLMASLWRDAAEHGASLVLSTKVLRIDAEGSGFAVHTPDATVRCHWLVNSAGLWASTVAGSIRGLASRHVLTTTFAKGNYFKLAGRSAFGRLVYPIPQRGGIGIHSTLDLGGHTRFGPDVEWLDGLDALDYRVDPRRAPAFYAAIRRYFPALPDGTLVPDYAGIRPKLAGDGPADFVVQDASVHGLAGLVNLFGIESPGLTSALELATIVHDVLRAGA